MMPSLVDLSKVMKTKCWINNVLGHCTNPIGFDVRLHFHAGLKVIGLDDCPTKKRMAHRLRSRYNSAMTGQDVKAMPVNQKLQIMEAIWEDFRDRFDRLEVPSDQKDLLDRRRARVREGAAQLLDWESVKGSIGKR